MTKLNDKQIAAYEAKGAKRWTKGSMDRLYINIESLGAEISYYGTGNVRSAKWQGERVSNADGRRLLSTKVFIDVNTGELSVTTSFEPYWTSAEQVTVEDAAKTIMAEVEAETAEPDVAEEEEAKEVYRKGSEYPIDGTDADFVRRVTYQTIGNGYINLTLNPWELADSIISAADLMVADGTDLNEVERAIRCHVDTTAALYDVY